MGAKLISDKEARVLELLSTRGELYGLALCEASGGDLKRGTIYVLLNRMEAKGYLESRHEEDPSLPGLPRRLYRPTGPGEAAFRMWEQFQLLHRGGQLA